MLKTITKIKFKKFKKRNRSYSTGDVHEDRKNEKGPDLPY